MSDRRIADRLRLTAAQRLLVIIIAAICAYQMCSHDERARIIREAEAEPTSRSEPTSTNWNEGARVQCKTGLVLTECRIVSEARLRRANVRLRMERHLDQQLKSCAKAYRRAAAPLPRWQLVAIGAIASAAVIGAFVLGAWLL